MSSTPRAFHFPRPADVRPRNQRDPGITANAAVRRALQDSLLKAQSVPMQDPRLVSSCHGTIERLLLTLPGSAVAYAAYRDAYLSLLSQLPDTSFVVLCAHNDRSNVDALLSEAGVTDRTEVVETSAAVQFSIWAEDAYVVVREGGTGAPTLVEPANFTRYDDGFIADIVSAQTNVRAHSAPLYFQGGNVLIGDEYWYVGVDYPVNALTYGLVQPAPGERPLDAALRRYTEELDNSRTLRFLGTRNPVPAAQRREITVDGNTWTELVYFGTGDRQPLFHIDMFVTLAGRASNGRPLALVGDSRMAADLLGEVETPEMLAVHYDDIARQLRADGLEVVRNPLPLAYADDTSRRERVWYFATANNALVQVTGEAKHVWMPTYGHGPQSHLVATDDANEAVFASLGFRVHRLADFHPFASNLGAVHCISKYLQRT